MKCKACHHLNCSSEAECFMCGAPLYRGAPKVHGVIFFFIALCVFVPVFSATGGVIRLLPLFGVNTTGLRGGGAPGMIPLVIGFLGVNVCLLVSRLSIPKKQQVLYCGVVAAVAWAAYLVSVVALARELTSRKPHRFLDVRPIHRDVAASDREFRGA